ncbi:uncharacterized protein BDR25DRAFT_320456 [Lindgomyces ingoldianus]|uniref:Uncharacterized protein n=1 Tax=Lindgomyces ingoldianus TaxID=673940 RepID=A0ACB6Q9M2_9PLEO|nr:uncharacterized protein BDR25DRAFT_320456 [Lindgomyces ingoldianus]KAF2462846.1 hypothetical protein BDR25DRAFT_320456 [Lindgomyces ingoldianus]
MSCGRTCYTGARIYVPEDILQVGDKSGRNVDQGPQNSKMRYNIESGKEDGATVRLSRKASKTGNDSAYYIEPNIFTNKRPGLKTSPQILRSGNLGPIMQDLKSRFSALRSKDGIANA